MKNFNPIIVITTILLLGFYACDSNNNFFNPAEALEAEQELLDRYYNEIMDDDLTRLDSLTAVSIDTVDHRRESGMMLFHSKIGVGDSIKAYKNVGFRYRNYAIGLTIDTVVVGTDTTFVEKTIEVLRESNENATGPFTFVTYPVGGVPAAGSNVFPGVNEAVMHMKLYGKAKVVLPSPIADNQFSTHIFELEVTYMEQ